MKTFFYTLLLAFVAQLALAIPPACLLHAVNTRDEPGDLSEVCGSGARDVQSYMAANCGNAEQGAQRAFIATCSSAGTSVAAYTATSTGASRTGTVTSARSSGSATGSAGSTQSTAGANPYYRGKKSYGAAAIALVGVVAAL